MERQFDKDRGQRMVEYCFALYDGENQPVRETPMWRLIVQLSGNMENPVRVTEGTGLGVGGVGVGMGEGFGDDLMLDFGDVGDGTGFESYVEQGGDGFTW